MTSDIKKKFEDHLILNRLAPKTQAAYLAAVRGLAAHYNESPDQLSNEQIQQYLVHVLRYRKLSWNTCNVIMCALCRFYGHFLHRKDTQLSLPPRPRQKKLPKILSRKQVAKLIETAKDIRYKALLMMTYGSGLRVSEVVALKREHIESDRMLVRVVQSKRRKDRYTLLSKAALEVLRIYWKAYFPDQWMFYGRDKSVPMCIATAQRMYTRCKKAAGLIDTGGIHTLRHCFATHLLEAGVDIYLIKKFLGHESVQSTMIYLHIVPNRLTDVKSPLDSLL